jgi:hypothetical protein
MTERGSMSRKGGVIFIAILGAVVGIAGVVVIATSSKGTITSGLGDPGEGVAQTQKRICNPTPPDYPGCSPTQQRALEAPNKAQFKKNYDKGRWGQGPTAADRGNSGAISLTR